MKLEKQKQQQVINLKCIYALYTIGSHGMEQIMLGRK